MVFKFLRQLFIQHGSVRSKMTLAFILMSCIPMAVLLFIAAVFAFPYTRELLPAIDSWFIDASQNPVLASVWLIGLLLITVLIALLGNLYLSSKVADPMARLSQDAKRMVESPGEVGEIQINDDGFSEITLALNSMTSKIKSNMEELQVMGQRTDEINREIHRRVMALNSLLQVGELIGHTADLDEVLDTVVDHLAKLDDRAFSALCLQPLEGISVVLKRCRGMDEKLLNQMIFHSSRILIDAENQPEERFAGLWRELGKPSILIHPILIRGKCYGILAFGNHDSSKVFSKEITDLVATFTHQSALAIEHEILLNKTKEYSYKDELTGAYNESNIRRRLAEEIRKAINSQRSCALSVFKLDGLDNVRKEYGELAAEKLLRGVAQAIQPCLSDTQRLGRLGDYEFLVILPDGNKREAMEKSEEMKESILEAIKGLKGEGYTSIGVGVAGNPIDGVDAESLLTVAIKGASESC